MHCIVQIALACTLIRLSLPRLIAYGKQAKYTQIK